MAPDSVSVPAVALFSPTTPPRIAVTAPARMSYAAFDVNTPVVPVIEPETSCTPATVSLNVATPNVPPLTSTCDRSASTLLAPSASVPALTVVAPV